MARTIKAKSRKENSLYFIESKGRMVMCEVKHNKRRNFLNSFDSSNLDNFSTYRVENCSSIYRWNTAIMPNYFGEVKFGSSWVNNPRIFTVSLEEEISREYLDAIDKEIYEDNAWYINSYDY
jgi:hypothetical protein